MTEPLGPALTAGAPGSFDELAFAIAWDLYTDGAIRGSWSALELDAWRYITERERREWNLSAIDRAHLRLMAAELDSAEPTRAIGG